MINLYKFTIFKNDLLKSKKYWILFILILILFTLFKFELYNYLQYKMEILALVTFCLLGMFTITYFQSHRKDKNLYKTHVLK